MFGKINLKNDVMKQNLGVSVNGGLSKLAKETGKD